MIDGPLPHASIGTVLGLLEHLRERPGGREDIYQLGRPLGFELDDLLPVTDAAKRLGLARVHAGDIELTPEGAALAVAEEPERKRRLAVCLRTLPLLAEIRQRAEEGGDHAARQDFLDRLQETFSPGEAARQLATALDWGRYGALFDLDPDSDAFVLPAEGE